MESSAALSTTGGLTLNLGLGFEYLIVGGGGGGGGNIGGGGGAGGLLTNVGGTALAVAPGDYEVTVGNGGAGGSANGLGSNGTDSSIFNETAVGGGGGGFYNTNGGVGSSGLDGGSGGGGGPSNSGGAGGGTASSGGGGNNGGSGLNTGGNGYRAGGGGGAGSAGASTSSSVKGNGGAGLASAITGSSVLYAAGGGGGTNTGDNQGSGGSGIGGNGASGTSVAATNGTPATGSGGGGGGYTDGSGGDGGSGVVVVRYRSATSLTSGGNTSGGYDDGSDDWRYEEFNTVGSGTLTVSGAFDTANLLATQTGVISGTGSLTYDSPGTLTLTAANTFSGATRVAQGTLNLGNALALQNSVLDMNAADSGTVAFTAAGTTYTLAGLSGSRSLDIGGNTLSLGGNATTSNFSGDLSGTGGSLIKTGTGTLTLSGTNSYSGGTTFATGTVQAGSEAAFGSGTVTVNGTVDDLGGTLDLNGSTLANSIVIANTNSGMGDLGALKNTDTTTRAVLNGTVQIGGQNYVGGDGDITLNGVVSGGLNNIYSLFKQGAGTWTFANEANTFDGLYYQIGGVTEVTKLANAGEASSLGQVSAGQNLFVFGFAGSGGGTLRYTGSTASTSDRVFSLQGSTAAADNTIEAAGTSAAATLTLTGGLSAGGSGSYTARLAGDNAGVNQYAGVIANGSGTVALEKAGSTTWALSGTNTYTGPTTVAAGTLLVNGALGNTAVTVASGAALGGSGTIAGTISGAGTVAPGNSPGILTAAAVDPSAGTDFVFEFSGPAPNYGNASASVNDVLRLTDLTAPFTSALTAANTKTLFLNFTKNELLLGAEGAITELTGGFFTDLASDFTALLNNETGNNAGFQVYVLGDGGGTDNSLNGVGYYSWRNPAMFGWSQSLFLSTVPQTADFGSGNVNGQVMLLTVAVPEPSTYALALAGMGLMGFSISRRRTGRRSAHASGRGRDGLPIGAAEAPPANT